MKIKHFILFFVAVICGVTFSVITAAYEITSRGLKSIPSDVCISSGTTTNQRNRIKDEMETWNDGCFGFECLAYDSVVAMQEYNVNDGINCVTALYYSDSNNNAKTYYVERFYPALGNMWYLVEFDMNFNTNSHTWYARTSTCPEDEYDFESIALHEFGHVLGLDHSPNKYYDDVREPMYAYTNSGDMHRDITTDDYNGIRNIYYGQ